MCDKIVDTYEYRPLVLDYDVEDIRRRYLKLYAGLIFDSMEELGIMNQAMDSGIYPLLPDMKVAGPAAFAILWRGMAARRWWILWFQFMSRALWACSRYTLVTLSLATTTV